MKAETVLKLTVRKCNNIADPNDSTTTLLVIGVTPCIPVHLEDLPIQWERTNVMYIDCQRKNEIMARNSLKTKPSCQEPGEKDINFRCGTCFDL